jgi:glyoxylase-like metal-dependent hydrolase (beta-lactamase superfamily II)
VETLEHVASLAQRLPVTLPVIIEADCHESYSRQRRKDPDMQLIFEQIRAGGDRDTRQGVLIDPSYSPEAFVQRATDQGLTVTHVINTHGHPDHTNGNATAAELTTAPVAKRDWPTVKQRLGLK